MPKKEEILQTWECPTCGWTYESYVRITGVQCPTVHARGKSRNCKQVEAVKPTRGVRVVARRRT